MTVGELCEDLSSRYGPEFKRILSARSVVVDGRTVGPEHRLAADEVALLPPVSGGGGIFRLGGRFLCS